VVAIAAATSVVSVIRQASAQLGGQSPAEIQRFERQLEQIQRDTLYQVDTRVPIDQRATFDYGAYLSFTYFSIDDNNNLNHVLRQTQILPYARLNIDGVHEFFVRGIWGWRDFNEGDSFDGRGDEPIDGDLDVGYYRFDLARFNSAYRGKPITRDDFVFKGGRDFAVWGNGLVISERLDGATIDVVHGNLDAELLVGVTPTRTVDIDVSRPKFDFNTDRVFYGGQVGLRLGGTQRAFVYGLAQQDNNDETAIFGPVTTQFDYNSWYLGVGIGGPIGDRIVYGIEAAYEGGNNLTTSADINGPFVTPVEQVHEDIQAWAADARIDYLFPDARRSRMSGEFIIASGDPDRSNTGTTFGGNRAGTKDHAFNAFGLLNTGLAFAPTVSNIIVGRVGASTFPFRSSGTLGRIQVGTDFFVYGKTQEDAPIDEPTIEGVRYLGVEPDFFLNWQMTSDLTLAVRYGIFFPNDDAFPSRPELGGGNSDPGEPRQFFSVSVTYAF
jgi:hypothetical protein